MHRVEMFAAAWLAITSLDHLYIARRNDRYDASKLTGEYRKERLTAA